MGYLRTAIGGIALVALAACHRTPSGQVAATVDGDEITVSEVRLEMEGADGGADDQSAVLQRLIARKLLYKEAEKQGLADSDAAKAARARAEESALAQLLEGKLVSETTADQSQPAIDRFITDHPLQFSDRRLITAERLIVAGGTPALLGQISGAKTMPAVEALLSQANVPFLATQTIIDTAAMPPAIASQIAGLNPDQLLVAPAPGGGIQVTHVLSSRVQPLGGDEAREAARSLIEQTRADAAQARLRAIVAEGEKHVWIDPSLGKT